MTRDSRPPSTSGIEIWRTASSSPPLLREPDGLPRADRSAARDEQRRTRAVAPALVEEPVEDVDLRRGQVEHAGGLGRHEPLALDHRRAAAEQLRGNDALQVLVELLEETEPAAVGLETEPVELLAEGGKSLGESALDLGLEQLEAVFGFVFGHCWHYRGSDDGGKAISGWLLAAGGDSASGARGRRLARAGR